MLSVLVLAITLSIDSLSVGLLYGSRGLRIGGMARLVLGAASMLLSALSLGLGTLGSGAVPLHLARKAGSLMLVAMGGTMAWKATQTPAAEAGHSASAWRIHLRPLGLVVQIIREPTLADVDRSGEVTPIESLALGFALAVDSMGAGFGAALAGYRSWLLPPAVGLACTLLFSAGHRAGSRASHPLRGRAALLPGVALMGLGLFRLF